jgi:hypothetical protein
MYEINEQLLLAILNYLGEKPFKEVNHLIAGIQSLNKAEPKAEAKEEKKK